MHGARHTDRNAGGYAKLGQKMDLATTTAGGITSKTAGSFIDSLYWYSHQLGIRTGSLSRTSTGLRTGTCLSAVTMETPNGRGSVFSTAVWENGSKLHVNTQAAKFKR